MLPSSINQIDPWNTQDFARLNQPPKENPVQYKNLEEISNRDPTYVILFVEEALNDPDNNKRIEVLKALDEINKITPRFRSIKVNGQDPNKTIPYLSSDKPVMVCGFYGEHAVGKLVDELIERGFEAYISRQGTCRMPAARLLK